MLSELLRAGFDGRPAAAERAPAGSALGQHFLELRKLAFHLRRVSIFWTVFGIGLQDCVQACVLLFLVV